MKVKKTEFEGLIVIEPEIFKDDRGHFLETYHEKKFIELGLGEALNPFQWNESCSKKGVLRGLHFQKQPFTQGKLVRVIKGKILDVVVDLRKNSPTYKKYFSVVLDDKDKKSLWIPKGFAHGFLCLEDGTLFLYGCTAQYNKESESGIKWDDPDLNIDWQLKKHGVIEPIVSEKDQKLSFFRLQEFDF